MPNDYPLVPVARPPSLPPPPPQERCCLSGSGFKNGVHLVAGPGAGKSRLIARTFAWQLLCRRQPQVIIDPVGGVVDNLLDKISRLPKRARQKLWQRLIYIDAGATDYVTPTPLYYRLSDQDTLFEIANRFPAILKRQDPDLVSAPILGWNATYTCAIHAGMIAAALGRQLDFVADLVLHPGRYKEELKQALATDAALSEAVQYFRDMMDPDRHALRDKQTGSFLTKLLPFLADERLLATFSGQGQGIDWAHAFANGHTILIDVRNEHDPDRRQFKLLWYCKLFTDFIKHRGMAGRAQAVTLIIDEITALLGQRSSTGHSLLAEDLEELVAVLARNYGVNVLLSHQNLSQTDERIQNVLMQLGTQIVGRIATFDDAHCLAQTLVRYDPDWVKKSFFVGSGRVSGERTSEFTVQEQMRLAADRILSLPKSEFLIRQAVSEGMITGPLRRLSIAARDPDQYPDPTKIAAIRAGLRQRCGVPAQPLVDEIHQRRPAQPLDGKQGKKAQAKALPKSDTIQGALTNDGIHPATPGISEKPAGPSPRKRSFWREAPTNGHAPDAA